MMDSSLKIGIKFTGVVLIVLIFIMASSSEAQINDYQIRRLILYKTDCRLDAITSQPVSDGSINYFVTCQNVSFYPDGVLVECGDQDDETTCEVKTESKEFNYKTLQPEQESENVTGSH